MPKYLIVEAGTISIAGKRFGPGVHEDLTDEQAEEATLLMETGVDHVMVSSSKPSEANVARTRIEQIRRMDPAANELRTAQQRTQAGREALQAALAQETGQHGDITENIALAEQHLKGHPEAVVGPRQSSSVLTTEDLKGSGEQAAQRAQERGVGAFTASAGEILASAAQGEPLEMAPQEKSAEEKREDDEGLSEDAQKAQQKVTRRRQQSSSDS
jgi:hypothetical protein